MKVKNKGITLIALMVTIVIMIILAGTSIGAMVGENGIIASTRYAVFASEMEGVKENVQMKKLEILTKSYYQNVNPVLFEKKLNVNEIEIVDTLKRELLYTRAGMKEGESPEDYNAEDFKELVDEEGIVKRMYVIDKETGNGKENTYIYDEETETVFKIPATTIAGKVYHSHNNTITLNSGSEEDDEPEPEGNIVEKESEIVQVGEEYYYGPNLKGFNKKKTYIVYYSEDYTKTKEVILEEYLKGGERRQIEEKGETYTFYDYGKKTWANIKTVANGQEAYWVWIPRYRYKINGQSEVPPIDVVYTDDADKPANKEKEELGEEYIVHPAFNLGEKKLKGIWISKYEPSYGDTKGTNKVLAPDMSGFDKENTYIELYDIEINKFTDKKLSEVNLDTINDNNEWYNYSKQKWANIKTIANGEEAWWVWIPRYAYKIPVNPTTNVFDVIFIDTKNRPIDREEYGEEIPETYEVHPAFTVGNKELQGIWMSKYEPSYAARYIGEADNVLKPDVSGFDEENTYLIYYSEGLNQTKEVKLKDYKAGGEKRQIQEGSETYTLYDYTKKIWANIKTIANGEEAWWVWIPRYAYEIGTLEQEKNTFNIIFIDTEDKPIDKKYGESLSKYYTVHPAFNVEGKKLKGIWMSKYEPSEKK